MLQLAEYYTTISMNTTTTITFTSTFSLYNNSHTSYLPSPHFTKRLINLPTFRIGSSSTRLSAQAIDRQMEPGILQKGIAEFYDESSGIWEDIWGDHMHHGFYEPDSTVSVSDHRDAQIRMIEEALRFAAVSGTLSLSLCLVYIIFGAYSRALLLLLLVYLNLKIFIGLRLRKVKSNTYLV